MHSSHMLREGARPEIVRDNMGHANIDVTQIVYAPSCRNGNNAAQNAEKEEKKNQPEWAETCFLIWSAPAHQQY